jgi:hypothetical protein
MYHQRDTSKTIPPTLFGVAIIVSSSGVASEVYGHAVHDTWAEKRHPFLLVF